MRPITGQSHMHAQGKQHMARGRRLGAVAGGKRPSPIEEQLGIRHGQLPKQAVGASANENFDIETIGIEQI